MSSQKTYSAHYYKSKFGWEESDVDARRGLVKDYISGLYWVLEYYHNGCKSWDWYYPHLYAPLASDLIDLSTIEVTFKEGRPFTPLMQLLSVLPAQSGRLLPEPYRELMTRFDRARSKARRFLSVMRTRLSLLTSLPHDVHCRLFSSPNAISDASPLAEFYPKDFEVDANGKTNAWEAVVKIPFIDEKKMIDVLCLIDHKKALTPQERLRNLRGKEVTTVPKASKITASEAPSPVTGKQKVSPKAGPTATARVSSKESPSARPGESPRVSPQENPKDSPKVSPEKGTPKANPNPKARTPGVPPGAPVNK